jgi:hypothetical protein
MDFIPHPIKNLDKEKEFQLKWTETPQESISDVSEVLCAILIPQFLLPKRNRSVILMPVQAGGRYFKG